MQEHRYAWVEKQDGSLGAKRVHEAVDATLREHGFVLDEKQPDFLVAAYVSVHAPALVEPAALTVPPWAESARRARASLDEHDLKLVDIAREEEQFYKDPIYRRAAARRMRLL